MNEDRFVLTGFERVGGWRQRRGLRTVVAVQIGTRPVSEILAMP
jgi:hypothetical protein